MDTPLMHDPIKCSSCDVIINDVAMGACLNCGALSCSDCIYLQCCEEDPDDSTEGQS